MKIPVFYVSDEAPCHKGDPDRFFATSRVVVEKVKAECRPCEFRERCLAYALHNGVEGLWGGTDETERKAIRHRLGIVPVPVLNHLGPRADWCSEGHPYDEANTKLDPRGHRRCRQCMRAHNRRNRKAS